MSHQIRAYHRYITDEGRFEHGDNHQRDETLEVLGRVIDQLLQNWTPGEDAVVHVIVELETPGEGYGGA